MTERTVPRSFFCLNTAPKLPENEQNCPNTILKLLPNPPENKSSKWGAKGGAVSRAVAVFDGKVERWCLKMPEMVIFAPSCVGKLPKTSTALFCNRVEPHSFHPPSFCWFSNFKTFHWTVSRLLYKSEFSLHLKVFSTTRPQRLNHNSPSV